MMESTRMAVMAVVAAMLCCVVVPVMESDAIGSEDYVIEMRTGDVFSYTPHTNLESTMGCGPLMDGMSWDAVTGTLTASFGQVDLSSDLRTTVTAVWTSPEGDLTQTASQRITFMVHPHVTIGGSSTSDIKVGVPSGTSAGTVIYTPKVSDASEGTQTEVSCSIIGNEWVEWDDRSDSLILMRDVPSGMSPVSMTVTVMAVNSPISEDSTLRAETAVANVAITVGGGLAITSPDVIEMVVSETDATRNTYVVTTNADMSEGMTVGSISFDTAGLPTGLVSYVGTDRLVFDPSVVEFPDGATGDDAVRTFTFTVRVDGTVDGNPVTVTKQVTLRVYADMEYTTAPSIDDITVVSGDSGHLDMQLSATIKGAQRVSVDWGDGTVTNRTVDDSYMLSMPHGYSEVRTYMICLEAVNEHSTSASYILYDASTGDYAPMDPPEEDDWDGWLFYILPTVVALTCAIMYATYVRHPLLLATALFAALVALVVFWVIS